MEPSNFYQAMTHSGWINAVQKKINFVSKNQTWELVDNLSTGKKPINAMWTFKAKSRPIDVIEY